MRRRQVPVVVLYLTLADALETHEALELRQAHEVDERDARRRGVLQEPLERRLRVDAEAPLRQLGVEDLEARALYGRDMWLRALVPAARFELLEDASDVGRVVREW